MDILDIAIAKSKATTLDLADISLAVSNYFNEHDIHIETDTSLSIAGMSADAKIVGDRLVSVENYALTREQIKSLSELVNGGVL